MKKPTIDYGFLLRCLQSPEDVALQQSLKTWLQEPEHAIIWKELSEIWAQAPAAAAWEGIDAPAAAKRFESRLSALEGDDQVPVRRLYWKYWTAAASVAALITCYWLWKDQPTAKQQWLTKTTQRNIDSLLLPDHSKIYLNHYAVIHYPASFEASGSREVELESGEAFFDVAHDPQHPFIVNSGTAAVRVLGTSFNMKINGRHILVAVNTGKVSLERRSDMHGVILSAGNQGQFDLQSQETNALPDDPNSIAWRTHRLTFRNTPMPEVCKILSAYYHVNILPGSLVNKKLTVRFDDNNLEEVLGIITTTYLCKAEKKNDTIYFK
ncbi:FecR family protein [Chitinophaga sp. Cy-1792]|uniref:FecR family protein n=1 Tax=Chitinophaga sp. Cy-1792 TaxID=2608339 RepID=UPI00141FBBB0|nr:FecR domain-containing protein [Chitinophaga sp. Cy-1792]NIG52953.1 DUF4974 domain-containing protein [Chitinophaga sp. Cy-1792]